MGQLYSQRGEAQPPRWMVEKKTAFEGTIECIGGTGRFEGFKGTGTFKGERIGDLKTGGDMYADFTMNCKKP